MELREELAALGLDDLRIRRAFDDGPEGIETLKFQIRDFGFGTESTVIDGDGREQFVGSGGVIERDDAHAVRGELLLEIFPRDEERIVGRNQLGVAGGVFIERSRIAEDEDGFGRQKVEQGGQPGRDAFHRVLDLDFTRSRCF